MPTTTLPTDKHSVQQRFNHWQDFALRMARTCYARSRRPTSRWIVSVVEEFFDSFEEDAIPCIVDWDNSGEYLEGNPSRRREYNATYCGCNGFRHNNSGIPNPQCPECRGRGIHQAWESPYAVGDMMALYLDEYQGYAPRCKACREYDDEAECRCDEISDLYYQQWDDQWGGPVHCCIRAGLDCAFEPSMGVIGFTAGDIRCMYPEGVPDWVKGDGPWDTIPIMGVVSGVGFVPGKPEVNGTFDELPDTASLWL